MVGICLSGMGVMLLIVTICRVVSSWFAVPLILLQSDSIFSDISIRCVDPLAIVEVIGRLVPTTVLGSRSGYKFDASFRRAYDAK